MKPQLKNANTEITPVGVREQKSYKAIYSAEFFQRKTMPSYALWAVSLKADGKYPKIPDGFGRCDTLEEAHMEMTEWMKSRGITQDDIRQDMIAWRLVKDLLEGKSGAEWHAKQIKRRGEKKDIAVPQNDGIVFEFHQLAMTSSLIVAKRFKKRHADVLRAIENMPKDEFSQRNFALTSYITDQGKTHNAYNMTWKGFSMLAMGFTGKAAYQWKQDFLNAFEAMGETIHRRYEDPPRKSILEAKRQANHLQMKELVEFRAEQGKTTEAKHFMCESKLCNWALTGQFAGIDENSLSNSDAALLEKIRLQNRALIDQGLPYEDRKKSLQTFALRKRTRMISKTTE